MFPKGRVGDVVPLPCKMELGPMRWLLQCPDRSHAVAIVVPDDSIGLEARHLLVFSCAFEAVRAPRIDILLDV
jgi:hypothetical protein